MGYCIPAMVIMSREIIRDFGSNIQTHIHAQSIAVRTYALAEHSMF